MGRLTLPQLVAAVAGRVGMEPAEVSEKVRSVFMSLVQVRTVWGSGSVRAGSVSVGAIKRGCEGGRTT
eukprot:366387-Chlamydomonas_euryale.AAC.16